MYYKISANASGFTTYEYLEVKTREEAETALREMVRDLKMICQNRRARKRFIPSWKK